MPYYQILQVANNTSKLLEEMLSPPKKKEKTGHKSISLHLALTEEGNLYASLKTHFTEVTEMTGP